MKHSSRMTLAAAMLFALGAAGASWRWPEQTASLRAVLLETVTMPFGVAHAQEDPDDDGDDDEDDDEGGDGVGDDDLGNDGAGDDAGDEAGGDDAGGDDVGDDAGDDGAGGDDDGPGDDGGGDDDGPGGGDDGPGGGDDDGPGDDGPGDDGPGDDDAGGGGGGRRGREDGDPPGGAGVRGLDADGGARIRDGDRDIAGPAALPAGVDVDFEGRWVRTGEILALEADPTSLELARGLGFQVIERYRLTTLGVSIVELRVPRGQQTRAALEAVRRVDPDTAYDFNHVYTPTQMSGPLARGGTSVPSLSLPFFAQSGAVQAAGATRSVGIIDTSIDAAHPALSRTTILQADFIARNARPISAGLNSHGTAVASILMSRGANAVSGARSNSRLFAANVVGRPTQGGSDLASADAMVRALDWLARNNAPVTNISLAGPPNALVEDAIRRAQSRGMIIVAAVGNDGPAAPPLYPAAYDGVIGVTAVDSSGLVYRLAGRGRHVDVAARGVGVDVAAPGGAKVQRSGTSFAAPVVAAALADAHTRPDAGSAQRAVDRLLGSLRDAGDRGRDPVYGAGVLTGQEGSR